MQEAKEHTFLLDACLHTWLATCAKTMARNELEVLRHIIHLLSFQIGDDHVYFIAASIVHSTQEHEFGELQGACLSSCLG
jgi:hypothetical protein